MWYWDAPDPPPSPDPPRKSAAEKLDA